MLWNSWLPDLWLKMLFIKCSVSPIRSRTIYNGMLTEYLVKSYRCMRDFKIKWACSVSLIWNHKYYFLGEKGFWKKSCKPYLTCNKRSTPQHLLLSICIRVAWGNSRVILALGESGLSKRFEVEGECKKVGRTEGQRPPR